MAKKKQNKNGYIMKTVDIEKVNRYKNQYLGTFKEMVKDEKNIDEMIGAVSMINAHLVAISMNDELVKKDRDLIIEAYHYAAERMLTSEKNEKKILHNWFGDYPLLFRMGSTLEYEKNKERIDFEYTLLDEEKQRLFHKILNATWKIREKRRISVLGSSVEIPKTVPKDELEEYYYAAKDVITTFLLTEEGVDSLIFALERADGDVISALRIINGEISIVEAEELEWCYSHDASTGKFIGNPDGEKYVDFNIEL